MKAYLEATNKKSYIGSIIVKHCSQFSGTASIKVKVAYAIKLFVVVIPYSVIISLSLCLRLDMFYLV